MDMFDKVNIAINGIGAFYPKVTSILAEPYYLTPEEVAMLKAQQVYGDVVLRFLNKDGEECDTELKERTISISLEQFKRIPVKITLASGEGKAYAVMSALKGGLIDVLIVDSKLGETILKLHREEEKENSK